MTSALGRKVVITVTATIVLLGWDLLHRLTHGISAIHAHSEQIAAPSALRHMRLTREEADYYGKVARHIEVLTARHPTLKPVTISPDGIYAAFDWGTREFGRLPVYWPLIAERIYPESARELCALLESRQALVIAAPNIAPPPGYCQAAYESMEPEIDLRCIAAAAETVSDASCPLIRAYRCPADTRSLRFFEPCSGPSGAGR